MNKRIHKINPYIIHCGKVSKSLPPGNSYGKRTIKWYELELISDGSGYIITEGAKIPASAGTVFFRKPGMKVEGITPYLCYIIIFDLSYDEKLSKKYSNSNVTNASIEHVKMMEDRILKYYDDLLNLPDSFIIDDINYYSNIFNEIFKNSFENSSGIVIRNKIILLNLIYSLSNYMSDKRQSELPRSIRNNFSRIMTVKRYIDEYCHTKITLSQLAEIADLSPNFLCSIFKRITGETPFTYLNSVRIKNACRLLTKTDKSIYEISYKSGFENDTYFYTVFKRIMGKTPSQYRTHRIY